MRRGVVLLCPLWFVASVGLAEPKLVTDERIWPELRILLGDESSYIRCSAQLETNQLYSGKRWHLRHHYHRNAMGHYPQVRVKKLVSCEGE